MSDRQSMAGGEDWPEDVDLDDLHQAVSDRKAARQERVAQRKGAGQTASSVPAERRHSRRHHSSHARSRHRHRSHRSTGTADFKRRVQLVLFVGLLLVGLVLVMRACNNERPVAPVDSMGASARLL